MTTTLTDDRIARLNRSFGLQVRPGAIIKLAPEGTDRPAAGWYASNTGDITLDGDVKFDKDLTIEGLVTHEASHSLWSNWLTMRLINSGELSMDELGVLKTLEEARIETKAVDQFSYSRKRLRACYSHLLADSFADPNNFTTVTGAITCWALAWGRTHSGVVDPSELDVIDRLVRDRFGEFPMDVFDDLLGEYCTLRFGHYDKADDGVPRRAKRIARDWLDLLRSLREAEGEDADGDEGDGGLGRFIDELLGDEDEEVRTGKGGGKASTEEATEEGDGGGSGEADGDDDGDEADGDKPDGGKADDSSDTDEDGSPAHGDGGSDERYGWAKAFEEAVKTVSADPTRKEEVRRMSTRDKLARIWAKSRSSENWREDKPQPEHARMIVRMAKALERDASPAVVRTRIKTQLPPGRLNGRGAVAQAADRAGGRMTTATPWRANKRHHIERPPVIIGVSTDTSGSMAGYTTMLGELAYVTAHASKRVNAKFAANTFGVVAEPVVNLGEMPDRIRVRSANSGHEAFDDAAAALDGVLRLTDKSIIGRKLLIVVSDGELVRTGERAKAVLWLKALQDGGTDVIWVGADEGCTEPGRYSYTTPLVTMAKAEGIRNVKWVPAMATTEEFVVAILANLRGA